MHLGKWCLNAHVRHCQMYIATACSLEGPHPLLEALVIARSQQAQRDLSLSALSVDENVLKHCRFIIISFVSFLLFFFHAFRILGSDPYSLNLFPVPASWRDSPS